MEKSQESDVAKMNYSDLMWSSPQRLQMHISSLRSSDHVMAPACRANRDSHNLGRVSAKEQPLSGHSASSRTEVSQK